MKQIEMYTDGACSGNPGIGACAAILRYNAIVKAYTKVFEDTTNNRMELMAVKLGLTKLKEPCRVTVYTDSANVIGWLARRWKRNDPAIAGICEDIEAQISMGRHIVTFEKVLGHSGHPENERCDKLAVNAIKEYKKNKTLNSDNSE
jgi:ribonuclease HI